ncbi:MAG: outer membrane beta-barrel protein, partial [Candidatus Saccharimonadales bacterium]
MIREWCFLYRRCQLGVAFIPVLVFCFTVLGSSVRLNAQVTYGISGTVTDAAGAIIPGANVTFTDNATGIISRAVTSAKAGTFTVILLNPGHYSVTVEAKGFKRSVQANVTVEIGKFSTADFTMVPGATNQTVQVAGHEISLNTTDPELGMTLEPELVKTAPVEINGGPRQINSFVIQAPGAASVQSGGDGAHYGSNFSIDGGITSEDNYYYNGIPITEPGTPGDQGNSNPPYEMISEFRVATSTFPAQYGLAQGSVTYNMASGTNQLHGDAFDILRNSVFDSDGFFPSNFNSAGKPEPPTNHQNDFGGTVSGPVTIPKVYDGRNRTFFLFSLDWYGQNQGQTSFGTVPLPAELHGDFSQYVDANGNQIPIYDPLTGNPFPGNIIPVNRFSQISSSLLPLIPAPNRTGIVFGQQQNELPAVKSVPSLTHLWGFTLDHNLTKSQSIHYSQYYSHNSNTGENSNIVPVTNILQSAQNNIQNGMGYILNYVNTLTPNLVVTAGVAKIDDEYGTFDATYAGANFPAVINGSDFPSIQFDGQNAISGWGSGQGQTTVSTRQIGISVVNNWLWIKGRHSLNVGAELRLGYEDSLNCAGCGGVFYISQRSTSTPNPSDPNFGSYGSSFASFLLGDIDHANRILAEEDRFRNQDFSPYIEDDFKVNPRLTVNAGLRWDLMVPFSTVNNNMVFGALPPLPGTSGGPLNLAAGNLPGTVTKYGNCAVGCQGADRADTHWGNFGPRFGFSYMVNDKTVVQGGLYVAYLDGGAYNFSGSRVAQNYSAPLAGEFNAGSTGSSVPGYGNWDTRKMPNPQTTPFSPDMSNGNAVRLLDRKTAGIAPYSESWNVNLQRQLPWEMFLTVALVGNRDIHLPSSLNQPNQLNPAYLALGNLLSQPVTSPAAVAAGIKIPYPNFLNDFPGPSA